VNSGPIVACIHVLVHVALRSVVELANTSLSACTCKPNKNNKRTLAISDMCLSQDI
jgi:hypothetical protein